MWIYPSVWNTWIEMPLMWWIGPVASWVVWSSDSEHRHPCSDACTISNCGWKPCPCRELPVWWTRPCIGSIPWLRPLRYSHFGCNVVHEDLAYKAQVDLEHAKYALKKTVEVDSHGKLPAGHGHGTEDVAPPKTRARWKRMDPLNVMNPGVGGTSENFFVWRGLILWVVCNRVKFKLSVLLDTVRRRLSSTDRNLVYISWWVVFIPLARWVLLTFTFFIWYCFVRSHLLQLARKSRKFSCRCGPIA